MKRELGVGVAALSALAAEGKDFSREELNAMPQPDTALREDDVLLVVTSEETLKKLG